MNGIPASTLAIRRGRAATGRAKEKANGTASPDTRGGGEEVIVEETKSVEIR